ncbi:hypothetical protein [uncultured Solobacterium sp.]|uniref:hypothetical protein n=1 Tax=uncultured Solobacterium sp. TaxID=747375 RepID=UPI0028DD2ABA|nr:hypothetical protein [uncultured Solobacterium sp.]
MKKYLKSLCAGLTISTALVLVGNQVTYAEETNTTTQASPAATSESSTTTAPTMSTTTTTTVTPTAPVTGTQSLPSAISTPYSTSVSTASSALTAVDNIVDIGGYVNVEGLPATLSEDGTGVTYSFTVSYQRLHSSDEGQTVSDLLIRVPNIDNADVKFTLVGTRDAIGNPVDVNVPMSIVDYNDAIENYTGDDEYGIPTAEGLANGKKAYVLSGNDYLQDDGKVKSYNIYTTQNHSQSVLVQVTIPMDQAKNIKYLPLDARAEWKASDGASTVRGYESGCQSLEEYSNHTVTMNGDPENVGGLSDVSLITDEYVYSLSNPSSITDDYVKDGHLIKSVSNPNTYITPNNGDWRTIPNDININSTTFFNYIDTFTLRWNPTVTYYAPVSEDMADQDVSMVQFGDVVVDYVVQGTSTQLQPSYMDTTLRPLFNADGSLGMYDAAENTSELPQTITYNGDVYNLVGPSATSLVSGLLLEGTTHVVYEYVLAAVPAPTPSTPSTPATPAAPTQSTQTPKTADTTNLSGYVAAFLAAFVGFSLTAVNRYKSNQIF